MLATVVPQRADGTTKLSAGSLVLETRAEGASDRQAELDDGKVIYRDAFTDTDIIIAAHGARYEELRVVRSSKAPTAARYRLRTTGKLRLEKGTIEVLDDAGRALLRTLPAYAVDASGTRRALEVQLDTTGEDAVLIAKLDTTGLSFPIVVDPTWVSGTGWPAETVVALNSVWMKEHSTITSTVNGAVAVIDVSPGPVLADDAEAVVGQNVTVNGTVSANRVRIKQGGLVNGDVRTNTLVNNGSISGSTVTPLTLPLTITVPPFPTFSARTTAVTLEQREDLTLAAGSYGDVLLKAGTTADPTVLTLSGGIYNLNGLNLGDKSRVTCAAACEIRIKNRLEPGQGAFIGPAAGSGIGAPDIQIFVEGLNGSSGNLGGTPKAAAIGFDNVVQARLLVPNGTLWLKAGTVATGVFVARDVSVGEGVSLTKDVTTPYAGDPNDGNPCTADSCDPGTGQVHHDPLPAGSSCANATACDGAETCDGAGTCQPGTAVVCTASDQCHDAGTCNPATGACSNPPKANGASCNDGDGCTQTDICQSGTCTGANPVVCTASDQCHTAGSCNPSTGVCTNPAKADDASCNDGDACTQTDTCQGGSCTGGNPKVCTASDQCHDPGTCAPATGVCSNPAKADGASCDDGNGCTQTDTCQTGACAGGNPVVCTALDQCHIPGTCAPGTGVCSNPNKANGSSCDDSNACTTGESCSSGACTGGTTVATDDGNPCTADACDPSGGVTHTPVAAGTSCGDSNVCNGAETTRQGPAKRGRLLRSTTAIRAPPTLAIRR
ncbi:MAG: hypothetical protein IPI67_22355, partial [Myxococcales bacterium]|nr:hypothetical protein [Myxococcales bacterium]